MSVVIETTLGDLTVDLFVKERPQTALNFLKLCKLKYYNLNLFNSVISNFCAQTGDPTGKGDGGESIHGLLKGPEYRFYQAETQPKLKHDRAGLLSMVSHGDRMIGSQFVITLNPDLSSLDNEHVVFGEVVEGSEVLLKLNEAIADDGNRPYQDIRITHTVILEDPFPDPPGMLAPPPSPLPPSTKDSAYSRIPADEPIADTCTQEELDEMIQAREAAARAAILEMVGDLPDAEIAPPENVLFVCKLNPVTSDHDLSIIFSRFGKVKNCEVIRDSVSGESLQYAFVEFENKKACEDAYFRMDNVLIDDRRIHVDFSQSVAKWRGKGKGVEMFGPPPKGGWGNKSRDYVPRGFDKNRTDNRPAHVEERRRPDRNIRDPPKRKHESAEKYNLKINNGSSPSIKNKVIVKKEVEKKKKRRSPSSSSASSQSSESSESSSSSDSSDSEPVKKRKKRTKKVLLVVKAPRGKRHKKSSHSRSKSRKYDSDSDSEEKSASKKAKKKKIHKSSTSDDESSDIRTKAKRTKRKDSKSKKKKKAKSESEDSSEEEVVKKKKRRKKYDSSSDDDKKKRRKKTIVVKKKSSKKRKRQSSESDSSSSD